MIETERLILTGWEEADYALLASINSDKRVMEYFPSTLTREESDAFINKMQASIQTKGWGFWAAHLKEDHTLIGLIGIENVNFEAPFTPAVEIGWRLGFPYWGKGYATEGAKAALAFAFDELSLDKVVSFTAYPNTRSEKVMQKLGMKRGSDFLHPKLPLTHPLAKHKLYEISHSHLKYT